MLQGRLVKLRAIQREDLPLAQAFLNDPEVLLYFGDYRPMTLPNEEDWFERSRSDPRVLNFAIEFEGRYVGGCGFGSISHQHRHAEIGIFVGDKSAWGRGVGTEAMGLLMAYGFEQLNFHRIYLRVFAENSRAIHVYEKLGFKHEACFREHEWRHGRWQDMLFMAVLQSEWAKQ